MLAKNALVPMEKRLKGYYSPKDLHRGPTKEVSVSNLVQLLIQGATDPDNLVRLFRYHGCGTTLQFTG